MDSVSSFFHDTKSSELDSLILRIPSQTKWRQFGSILLGLPNHLLWNALLLVTSVLNYLFVTIDLVFPQESYENFLVFYVIFDVFYLFNLLILALNNILSSSVVSKEDYSLVIIIIDFLSLVPQLLLILLTLDHSFGVFIPLLRVSSILRLRHLTLFKKKLEILPENKWKWFIAQYVTVFGLAVHVTVCIWFLIQCDQHCNDKLYNLISTSVKNPVDWYFYHLYYSIEIFLNVGFGDTFPKNFNEIFLFSIMMVFGQALMVWLVCYLTWFLINQNYFKVYIAHKIKDAREYLSDVDETLKLKISQYYSKKENKLRDNSLQEILSLSLRQDIFYDLNCGLLHRSMILKGLPEKILKQISAVMKTVKLPAGESIYFQYVVKTCMVCIEDGVLEVLNDEDQESPVIFFRKGTILGEVALFLNVPSKATVRARKDTELRVLEKRDFLNIMLHFPEVFKSLQASINKRLTLANKSQKPIQKFSLPSLRRLKLKLTNILPKNDDILVSGECYDLYKMQMDNNFNQETEFHKKTELIKIWKIISDIIIISFCLIYPYYAVFEKKIPNYLNYFGICADIVCFFDVVVEATMPLKIKGNIVTDVLQVLDKKLNEWNFNMDIFSLFPIEFWSFLFKNTIIEYRFFDLFKLNRLLRLHRVPKLTKILVGKAHSLISTILKNLIYAIVIVYYSACVLYVNTCFGIICDDEGWYYQTRKNVNDDNEDPKTGLVDSFYFAVSSAFCTGIGDILPKSTADFWIVSIIILTFLTFKSLWIGQIISSVVLKALCCGYLETTYYMNYLSEVHRIPSNLKLKLIRFLEINQFFYSEKSQIFIEETLPNSIKDLIKISRRDIWQNIPLFQEIDPYLLTLIENEVGYRLLPKNEIVYPYGDPTRRMFLIKRGYCDLYNPESCLEKTVGPGSQLGLLEMIYCLPKKYTVLTKTDCILFSLDYSVLDKNLKLFPKENYTVESVMFQKDLLESVANLEMIEDSCDNNEIKEPEQDESSYIYLSKKRPNYYQLYKEKWGFFWFFGLILMPLSIYPQSFFLKLWCTNRACFIVLETIVNLAITISPSFANYLTWIVWVCQGTLYLEMYINFHIGYYDSKGSFKDHPVYTSWYYLSHGFLLDLVAAIPWQYFMFNSYNQCFWNLLKLVQFYKVLKCINYFEEDYFKSMKILKIFKFSLVIVVAINVLIGIGLSQYYFGFDKIQDTSNMYTVGFYNVVDWLTSTGTGYFQSTATGMKIETSLIIFFGFFLFSIITSSICTNMLAESEETIDFRNDITKLFEFLDTYYFNADLKRKIMGHFSLIWEKTKGFNIDSKKYTDTYFREKLLNHFYEEICFGVPLLYHFDISFTKLVLSQVRIQYFQKGEVIVKYKDVLSNIFIVTSGQVAIFNQTKEPLCILGPAAVFGNIRKNIYGLSTIYVEARRNVELLVLNTQKFFNTVKYYPLIVQELERMLKGNPAYLQPFDISNVDMFNAPKEVIDSDEDDLVNKPSNTTVNTNRTWTGFVLEPNHVIFKVLNILTFTASLANVITIPYIFVTQEFNNLGYMYLCLEPIFYVRIFFKLHQSYVNFYGNVVTSHRKIYKRYSNTPRQFFWDIVPNLPVTLIFYCFPKEEQFFCYTILRLFHLLRFYYIMEFFQLNIGKLFRRNVWHIARLAVYYIILVHTLACTWFMLACPFNKCTSNTWLSKFRKQILQKPSVYKIILSYYHVLNLFTTTGIGDIIPKSYNEIVFTIITVLIGKIFISVIIGTVLNVIFISEKQYLKFDGQTKSLNKYLEDKNVSDFLLEKTSLYLKNLWIYNQGNLFRSILNNLSYPLLQDFTSALYGNQISEAFLFKGLDDSLLQQICTKLTHSVYFKDDYIVKAGDVNSTMYFIYKGNAIVLTKHPQLTETKHVILRPMDLFGVSQGLNLEECHQFCYRAATSTVEVLSLKYDDWSYLLDFFPRDKTQIFVRVHREYSK